MIIAHRGASGEFPENTLPAFSAAIEAGAQMCELDVQLTRDAAAVVIHDENVDRTTDATGPVAAMNLAADPADGRRGEVRRGVHRHANPDS